MRTHGAVSGHESQRCTGCGREVGPDGERVLWRDRSESLLCRSCMRMLEDAGVGMVFRGGMWVA